MGEKEGHSVTKTYARGVAMRKEGESAHTSNFAHTTRYKHESHTLVYFQLSVSSFSRCGASSSGT